MVGAPSEGEVEGRTTVRASTGGPVPRKSQYLGESVKYIKKSLNYSGENQLFLVLRSRPPAADPLLNLPAALVPGGRGFGRRPGK